MAIHYIPSLDYRWCNVKSIATNFYPFFADISQFRFTDDLAAVRRMFVKKYSIFFIQNKKKEFQQRASIIYVSKIFGLDNASTEWKFISTKYLIVVQTMFSDIVTPFRMSLICIVRVVNWTTMILTNLRALPQLRNVF